MRAIEEIIEQGKQADLTLEEAIEHAEQKAADENCSCRGSHQQLADWLKELQKFREERKILEEPYGKEYKHLEDDLEALGYLANEMAFNNLDISLEHAFVWRSVKEIALKAARIFNRAKYFEKECGSDD